jgi:hypothetical protein
MRRPKKVKNAPAAADVAGPSKKSLESCADELKQDVCCTEE